MMLSRHSTHGSHPHAATLVARLTAILAAALLVAASAAIACDSDTVSSSYNPNGLGGGGGGSWGQSLGSRSSGAIDNPSSCDPIELSRGFKRERFVDLDVPLTGEDFRLERMYTSQTDAGYSHNLVGANWWMNVFSSMSKDMRFTDNGRLTFFENPWVSLTLRASDAGAYERFDKLVDANGNLYQINADIYAQRRVIRVDVGSMGNAPDYDVSTELRDYAAFALVTPGVGERYYRARYDSGDVAFTNDVPRPPNHVEIHEPRNGAGFGELYAHGLLLQERDTYGNSKTYIWNNGTPGSQLQKIVCRARPSNGSFSGPIEAEIVFTWDVGRLTSVKVMRPIIIPGSGGGTQDSIETQRVEYTYFDTQAHDPSVGTGGDLVQTTRFERLDDADHDDPLTEANAKVSVWQYRYHRTTSGYSCLECEPFQNPPETFFGAAHQLKMVIEPGAIEYATHKHNVAQSSSVSVTGYASALLELPTTDVIFSEGGNRTVRDLASKFLQYDESGRVTLQEFGAACGCGGGGAGGAPGRRLVYAYSPVFTVSSQSWMSVRIRESIAALDMTGWVHHLDRHYDLRFIGAVERYDMSADPQPYLVNEAIIEIGGQQREWMTHYVVDDFDDLVAGEQPVVETIYTPSSVTSYTPVDLDTLPFQAPTGAWYTLASDRGRVVAIDHTEGYYNGGTEARSEGDFRTETTTTYHQATSTAGLPHLPQSTNEFMSDNLVETTWYSYGFHANTPDDSGEDDYGVAWISAFRSAELEDHNGPGDTVVYTTYQLFDRYGNNTHNISADGVRQSMTYDTGFIDSNGLHSGGTGEMIRRTDNSGEFTPTDDALYASLVNGNAQPITTSIGDSIDSVLGTGDNEYNGGALTFEYERDALGQIVQETSPGGVTSSIHRGKEIEPIERAGTPIYFELRMPHGFSEGSETLFNGPAVKRWITAGGLAVRESAFAFSASGGYDPLDNGTFSLTDELSRRVDRVPLTGLVSAREIWSDISLPDADIVEGYFYDGLGRRVLHVDANNNAERTTFDVLDRTTRIDRGTRETSDTMLGLATPGSGNLVPVMSYKYDEHLISGVWTPIAGNGLLTTQIEHDTGDILTGRSTYFVYDEEERRIAMAPPEPPFVAYKLDGRSQVVTEAHFGGSDDDMSEYTPAEFRTDAATSTPFAQFFSLPNLNRVRLTETLYGQRGLVYRTQEATNPGADPVAFVWLETNSWFDAKERVVAQAAPNSPTIKTAYDGHDRPHQTYWTDARDDSDYDDATQVTDDVVLQQVEHKYVVDLVDGVGPHVGQRVLTMSRQRLHDSTATGALTSSNSITTYVGAGYDGADRPTLQISFGTTESGFGTSTTPPSGSGPNGVFVVGDAAAGSIYQRTEYDDRGRVGASISSGNSGSSSETRSAFFYDDADRRVGVIENRLGSAAVIRDTSGSPVAWGWILADLGGSAGLADQNRATITAYDSAGNMTRLIAARHDLGSGIEYQVTRYIYEARTSDDALSGPGSTISNLINSNSALTRIEYPMAFDETDTTDVVEYRVNALGETIGMEDQNGTVHLYELDGLGRLRSDAVAVASGSGVDGTIDQIAMTYDGAGRLASTRSYDGAAVVNAVEFSYNGLGQVTEVEQNPAGDVGTGLAASVKYEYEVEGSGTGYNYSRMAGMKYPAAPATNRTEVLFGYGTSSGDVNDRISRPTAVAWEKPPVGMGSAESHAVRYERIGLGMIAEKDLDFVSVRLTRSINPSATSSGDVEVSGSYPGYDRLGRVRTQTWLRDSWSWNAKPAMVDLRYVYNEDTDLEWRWDMRGVSGGTMSARPDRDEEYAHDGLHRLGQASRGQVTGHDGSPSLGSAGSNDQRWSLDALGNWDVFERDGNGDADFADAGSDTVDARTHNAANEIVGRAHHATGGPPTYEPFDYDAAGNLTAKRLQILGTTNEDVWTYTYDAWNRLVRVEVTPYGGSVQTRAEYSYNGLYWRVSHHADSDANGTLDQGNLFYYDENWRLLEERIDDNFTASDALNWPVNFDVERITQLVWGLEYLDELLYFQTDVGSGGPADGEFYAGDDAWYALVDRMFSVIGVVDLDGDIVERVRYTPYGEARHEWRCDVNGDGAVAFADLSLVLDAYNKSFGAAGYNPDCDFDFDGDVDFADLLLVNSFVNTTALTAGQISSSSIRNIIGYDGYLYDPAVGMSYVRHRGYDAGLGRWTTRDPASYTNSLSLYEYAASWPMVALDPYGLAPVAIPAVEASRLPTKGNAAGGQADYAAVVTTKSFIAATGIASVDIDFMENPPHPTSPEGRLTSRVIVKVSCCNGRVKDIQLDGRLENGKEIFGQLDAVITWSPSPFSWSKGDRAGIAWRVKGRPNKIANFGIDVQGIIPPVKLPPTLWPTPWPSPMPVLLPSRGWRTPTWIWHEVEGEVYCQSTAAMLSASLDGSGFPSHRVWVEGGGPRQTNTIPQGQVSDLWISNPANRREVR